MNYQDLLKRAYEKIPKRAETKDRFLVPRISSEVSGNKTLVKNFSEIASYLKREASHLAKYFFKELATAGSLQNNILILTGKFQRDFLQKKLEDYIKEFVYCKQCGEPDTKLLKEDRITFLKCDACGAKHSARSV